MALTEPPTIQEQIDIESLYHRNDPDTSREAARSQGKKLSAMHQAVLDIFEAYPEGLTSSELAVIYQSGQPAMGWPRSLPYTPIKRKSDLAKMGRLIDTGLRRPNEHGLNESVWRLALTPAQRNFLPHFPHDFDDDGRCQKPGCPVWAPAEEED